MSEHPFTANRLRFELKPQQTQKLKQIAEHYQNHNLLHQINLMIDGLWRAIELDKQEGKE